MKKILLSTLIPAALIALAPTPAAAAETVDVCGPGYGVGAGTPTSCAFASVARATWLQDTRQSPIVVYSPTTNMTYTMYCNQATLDGHFAIHCMGGNDADVWLW
jgi:hypothetical protein